MSIYCSPIIKESGPINIQLQGVACMNDDPTEVKVLFAQVVPNEKLQEIVDKISNYFDDIGKNKFYTYILCILSIPQNM